MFIKCKERDTKLALQMFVPSPDPSPSQVTSAWTVRKATTIRRRENIDSYKKDCPTGPLPVRVLISAQCVTDACLMNDFTSRGQCSASDTRIEVSRHPAASVLKENGKLFIRALRSGASLD